MKVVIRSPHAVYVLSPGLDNWHERLDTLERQVTELYRADNERTDTLNRRIAELTQLLRTKREGDNLG